MSEKLIAFPPNELSLQPFAVPQAISFRLVPLPGGTWQWGDFWTHIRHRDGLAPHTYIYWLVYGSGGCQQSILTNPYYNDAIFAALAEMHVSLFIPRLEEAKTTYYISFSLVLL